MLITYPLSRRSVEIFLTKHVDYRPELVDRVDCVESIEDIDAPRVVLARHDQVELIAASARRWPSAPIVVVCLSEVEAPGAMPDHEGGCTIACGCDWVQAEHEAFLVAEEACRPSPVRPTVREEGARTAILVGAGIVALVTALAIVERGWSVQVFDRIADPLVPNGENQALGGATFGDRDARVFSFDESRHHLARSPANVVGGGPQFRHSISREGWLSVPTDRLQAADRAWIDELQGVPAWAAMSYGNDILRFNVEGQRSWWAIFDRNPELLRNTGYVGRLLRIYQTEASFASALQPLQICCGDAEGRSPFHQALRRPSGVSGRGPAVVLRRGRPTHRAARGRATARPRTAMDRSGEGWLAQG